ncbi:hypothetical protein FB451DRAFT_1566075 [Mycena latifolia]|nr:hypothetical protein FB451DRAFT_1566075 [Mycena latifolia]
MGKSAKLHKRPKNLKKASTGTGGSSAAASVVGGAQAQAQSAKKKAGLKQKVAAGKGAAPSGGHVLGGVDYVNLMMGSRRQAREEAAKLPRNNL